MELPVEQQEDDQDGDGCGQEQRMTGASSALKLSSVLDAVALGKRYLTVQSIFSTALPTSRPETFA